MSLLNASSLNIYLKSLLIYVIIPTFNHSSTSIVGRDDYEGGCCDMHTAALAAGLALSLVERKVKKRVVNYWEPFQDLYKQLKTAIKYVFDKENKRFKDYNDVLRQADKLVIVVYLPNSTRVRVAGALILLQDSICSLHSLRYYALKCEKFEALCLNRIQWK